MDDFKPQSSLHVKEGHDETEFSLRAIVAFAVTLVFSGIFTFVIAHYLMIGLEWWERRSDVAPSAVQQQLNDQREGRAENAPQGKEKQGGAATPPEWYDKQIDEKAVLRIFSKPVLQYDDTTDMGDFLNSEEKRLQNTGKDTDGHIHIPIERAIDLITREGHLPEVNGTFTAGPPLDQPEAISQAAAAMAARQGQGGPSH